MAGQQTPSDYLKSLQLEYICAEMRFIKYPDQKDKNYWERVMNNKADKIESLSKRLNCTKNILNNDDLKQSYYLEIFPISGNVRLLYKDNIEREDLLERDNLYILSN